MIGIKILIPSPPAFSVLLKQQVGTREGGSVKVYFLLHMESRRSARPSFSGFCFVDRPFQIPEKRTFHRTAKSPDKTWVSKQGGETYI